MYLSVPIPGNGRSVTIYDCLNEYFKNENLTGSNLWNSLLETLHFFLSINFAFFLYDFILYNNTVLYVLIEPFYAFIQPFFVLVLQVTQHITVNIVINRLLRFSARDSIGFHVT